MRVHEHDFCYASAHLVIRSKHRPVVALKNSVLIPIMDILWLHQLVKLLPPETLCPLCARRKNKIHFLRAAVETTLLYINSSSAPLRVARSCVFCSALVGRRSAPAENVAMQSAPLSARTSCIINTRALPGSGVYVYGSGVESALLAVHYFSPSLCAPV